MKCEPGFHPTDIVLNGSEQLCEKNGGSSTDPVTYIVGGIILGVAVDVVLVLAEKAYQVVQSYLTHKENK